MKRKLFLACYAHGRRDQVLLYDPHSRRVDVVSVNPSNLIRLTANRQVQILADFSAAARAGKDNT